MRCASRNAGRTASVLAGLGPAIHASRSPKTWIRGQAADDDSVEAWQGRQGLRKEGDRAGIAP